MYRQIVKLKSFDNKYILQRPILNKIIDAINTLL